MSILKFINVFFLQWFFIRLTKCQEKRIEDYKLLSVDLVTDGCVAAKGTGNYKTYQWFSIQYWILPCTGWWTEFVFLTKEPKFIKLTKEKLIPLKIKIKL